MKLIHKIRLCLTREVTYLHRLEALGNTVILGATAMGALHHIEVPVCLTVAALYLALALVEE